jgi:hypothetical protein
MEAPGTHTAAAMKSSAAAESATATPGKRVVRNKADRDEDERGQGNHNVSKHGIPPCFAVPCIWMRCALAGPAPDESICSLPQSELTHINARPDCAFPSFLALGQ